MVLLLLFLGSMSNRSFSQQAMANDVKVIVSSMDYEVCFSERFNFSIPLILENLGNSAVVNVTYGIDFPGNSVTKSWNGTLSSGESTVLDTLGLSFASAGDYQVKLWVNNYDGDVNEINDSIVVMVHVLPEFKLNSFYDTTVCFNEVITYNAPSGHSGYHWSNGAVGNTTTIPGEPGMYSVSITDNHGCQAIDSFNIDVFPYAQGLLPGDTTFCDGEVLTVGAGFGYDNYNWSTGANGSEITIRSSGIYSVTVVDTMNCSYTEGFEVNLLPLPTPGINGVYEICDGDTALVQAAINYSSYNWSTGDTLDYIQVMTPGIYTVTVLGINGCLAIDTASIVVLDLPEMQFSENHMCNDKSIVLEVGAFMNYQWSTGDVSPYLLIETPGVYNVTVQDFNGCFSMDSIEIENFDVEVELGKDTVICEGSAAFVVLPDTYDHVLWSDGDTSKTHYIGSPGIHSVTVTNGECSISDNIKVEEDPIPEADFSYLVTSPDVQFYNYSNGTNVMWHFGDLTTSVDFEPNHSFPSAGVYEVTLVLNNACGADSMMVPLSIYPQADHALLYNYEFKIYPSIAADFLNIKYEGNALQSVLYKVVDSSGKLVGSNEFSNGLNSEVERINVSSFASGMYFIQFYSEGVFLSVQKFIVE